MKMKIQELVNIPRDVSFDSFPCPWILLPVPRRTTRWNHPPSFSHFLRSQVCGWHPNGISHPNLLPMPNLSTYKQIFFLNMTTFWGRVNGNMWASKKCVLKLSFLNFFPSPLLTYTGQANSDLPSSLFLAGCFLLGAWVCVPWDGGVVVCVPRCHCLFCSWHWVANGARQWYAGWWVVVVAAHDNDNAECVSGCYECLFTRCLWVWVLLFLFFHFFGGLFQKWNPGGCFGKYLIKCR